MDLAFCFSPFSMYPINLLTFTAPCICRASWPLRRSRAQSLHSLLGSRASLSRQPRAVAQSNLSPHRRGLQLISNQKRGKFFWVWPNTHAAAQTNNHAQKRLHSVCFLHPASGPAMLTADDVIRPGRAAIDLGVPHPEKARQKRVTGAAAARRTSRCWSRRPKRSGRCHWETSVSPRSG